MNRKLIILFVVLALAVVFAISQKSRRKSPTTPTRQTTKGTSQAPKQRDIERDTSANPAFKPLDRVALTNIPAARLPVVRAQWKKSLAAEGFKTFEFRFDRGYISAVRNQPDEPQTAIWPDVSGSCQLELPMKNFVPTGPGRVDCFR